MIFTGTDRSRSTVVSWYVLIAMLVVFTLSIADRYVISTVLEPIRLELHLSDSGVAFLTGSSLALFYVTFGFPISWLVDRGNRRNIIAASVLLWSAMTAFCGISRNYWQLLLSRIGVGIGEAGGTPGANSILADYFPVAKRPMALTVFSLGAPIGAWLGASVAGDISDHYGWRSVFLALGVPGVAIGIIAFLTIPEPIRGRLDALSLDTAAPTFRESMRYLLSQRSAVHLTMGTSLTALWGWGLMWWTPTFLARNYGLTTGEAGALLGPIHVIAGSVVTALTAWWLGRPRMADPRRILWIMGTGVGLGAVVSFVIYWTSSLALATALLWIFIPSIYFYVGPGFGLMNNLCEPRMRAQCCAAKLLLANVGNLIVAPQLVGFISDWAAPNQIANGQSLRIGMMCLVPFGFWAAAHYFWATLTVLKDQERATGVHAALSPDLHRRQ